MRIAILRIGSVDMNVSERIRKSLCAVFPGASCEILEPVMPIPEKAYKPSRHQYHSSNVLAKIRDHVEKSGQIEF